MTDNIKQAATSSKQCFAACFSKDAEREFCTTLGATQDGPTISRSELGALPMANYNLKSLLVKSQK